MVGRAWIILSVNIFFEIISAASGARVDSKSIPANSKFGHALIGRSRRLDNRNVDYSFIGGYSIKFQGCHHINQWNENADDEDDVRIMTKRLIRFRLCPTDMCQDSKTGGCNSHYGDYVVDMNVFVDTYLQYEANILEDKCEQYGDICDNACGGGDDDCFRSCYANYGLSACYMADDDAAQNKLDAADYSYCANFNFPARDDDYADDGNGRRRLADDDGGVEYYVGPYCADQGGEINLGLFTDDTCTTFANGGRNLFYKLAGYELPYGNENMIAEECLDCMVSNEDDDVGEWSDDMDENNINELCSTVYLQSGKCEAKMSTDYPNESACTYIEGIKIIRDDGVIRTTSVKKSRAAAVSIGLFTTVAVLLGAYVYYLRTKLGRAKISLSAQG